MFCTEHYDDDWAEHGLSCSGSGKFVQVFLSILSKFHSSLSLSHFECDCTRKLWEIRGFSWRKLVTSSLSHFNSLTSTLIRVKPNERKNFLSTKSRGGKFFRLSLSILFISTHDSRAEIFTHRAHRLDISSQWQMLKVEMMRKVRERDVVE